MKNLIALFAVPTTLLATHAFAAPIVTCSPNDRPAIADVADAVDEASDASFAVPGAVLNFRVEDGNWVTKLETNGGSTGVLFAGGPLELISAASRFPRCGNSNVTGYVRTNDGRVFTVPMGGYDMMLNRFGGMTIPSDATSIDVWFKSESQTSDRYGSNVQTCTEYDSNFGQNFHFDLKPFRPDVATFGADGAAPAIATALKAGDALTIDYDPARLQGCRTSHMGYPTWGIRAHARFDNGTEEAMDVVAPGDRAPSKPSFGIPDGARHVDVWFENYGRYPGDNGGACQAWDSNGGANYSFDVR